MTLLHRNQTMASTKVTRLGKMTSDQTDWDAVELRVRGELKEQTRIIQEFKTLLPHQGISLAAYQLAMKSEISSSDPPVTALSILTGGSSHCRN